MVPNPTVKFMRDPVTVAGGTIAFGIIDTKGFDYGVFLYLDGPNTAAGTPDIIRMGHDDTLSTAVTDGTVLTAFQGGTAIDSTHGFVLQAISVTGGARNTAYFGMDLRGKKRYISMDYEADGTHSGSMVALLSRAEDENVTLQTDVTVAGIRHLAFG